MTLESALLAALSVVTSALVWAVKLLYARLQMAEQHVLELRLTVETLQHENGVHSAKVEMFERCPAPTCPFHKAAACALALLCVLLLPSCLAMVEVERPSGTQISAAVAVGTDADEISRPGGWKATGVNNSKAAGALKSGVITREGLRLAAPAVTSLGGSVGTALETVAQ